MINKIDSTKYSYPINTHDIICKVNEVIDVLNEREQETFLDKPNALICKICGSASSHFEYGDIVCSDCGHGIVLQYPR